MADVIGSDVEPPPVFSDNLTDDSKREYLLAQIRQKDAIIESLLKQVSSVYSLFNTLWTRLRPFHTSIFA